MSKVNNKETRITPLSDFKWRWKLTMKTLEQSVKYVQS